MSLSYTYQELSVPGSTDTVGEAINAAGDFVGRYADKSGKVHGFLYHAGTFTTIDVPGASSTDAVGISADGAILLQYKFVNGSKTENGVAFYANGAYADTVIPGSSNVFATSLAAGGYPTGYYVDGGGVTHGFVSYVLGSKEIDVPGATSTIVQGLTSGDLDAAAGTYIDGAGKRHGFIQTSSKTTTVDVPGADGTAITAVAPVDLALLTVAGTFTDGPAGETRAFANIFGTTAYFDAPGADVTMPTATNGALVTGYYVDPDSGIHGFVWGGGLFYPLDDPNTVDEEFLGININNQIVGTGLVKGHYVAVVGTLARPAITVALDITTNLHDPVTPFAAATVTDPIAGATDSATIAIQYAAGTLAGAGLTANPDGTYSLAFTDPGTLSKELQALTFTPATVDGTVQSTSLDVTITSSTGAQDTDSVYYTLDSTPNQKLFGTTTTSAVSPQGEVDLLYIGLLDRGPDALGAEDWVAQFQGGATVAQVTRSFLDSTEGRKFFTPNSSDANFVNQLYDRVLDRPGSTSEKQGWIAALQNGASRADVADGFVFSAEFLDDLKYDLQQGVFTADAATSETARLYYSILGRAPDAGGLAGQTQSLNGGLSLTALAQRFLDSPEYAADHPTPPSDEAFVTALYAGALGRAPEAAGLAGYEAELKGGTSRAAVAVQIAESPEARQHLAGRIETGFHLA